MEINQKIWILKTGRCPECYTKAVLMEETKYKKTYYCTNTKCLSKWIIEQGRRKPTLFWKILSFWPWFIKVFMNKYLPENHEWKNKEMTIEDWARNGTELSMFFGAIQWFNLIAIIICILVGV